MSSLERQGEEELDEYPICTWSDYVGVPHFVRVLIPTHREIVLYRQPTGPNPLHHRHDLVDRPRAMEVVQPLF